MMRLVFYHCAPAAGQGPGRFFVANFQLLFLAETFGSSEASYGYSHDDLLSIHQILNEIRDQCYKTFYHGNLLPFQGNTVILCYKTTIP